MSPFIRYRQAFVRTHTHTHHMTAYLTFRVRLGDLKLDKLFPSPGSRLAASWGYVKVLPESFCVSLEIEFVELERWRIPVYID
jgi:hypothetical protein